MKLQAFVILSLLGLVVCSGCRSPFYADQGALIGGLAGAGIGAAVGDHNDNALLGTAIGAAGGALAGGLAGNTIDNAVAAERAQIEQQIGRQLQGAATVDDVIIMTRQGVAEPVILNYIRNNGVAQRIATTEIIAMHNAGVSPTVIDTMQQTPSPHRPVSYNAPIVRPVARPIIIQERYVRPYCHGPGYYRSYHHHHPARRHVGVSLHHHF